MSEEAGKSLTLQELPELRRKTEAVSKFLKDHLAAHLETLRPLLSPERILGKYAGGKVDMPGTERALADLQQSYRPFTGRPYDLPSPLDTNWLTLVGSALEIHPWEYTISLQGKEITMSSPVKWVVNYRTTYSPVQVASILAGRESARPEHLRQFVVNQLVLQLVLNRQPGLVQLLQALRYEFKTEARPELKGLPVMTVTSCLTSFRPADDLISAATAFSGIPAFVELMDLDAVSQPHDVLKEKLVELLQ